MIKKKAFALRIEEDLFMEIEKLAKEEYRSVNGQIEWMLRKVLSSNNRY